MGGAVAGNTGNSIYVFFFVLKSILMLAVHLLNPFDEFKGF